MADATYKDAGVDLAEYAETLSRLPRLLRRTYTPRVIAAEGGFAGLMRLDFGSPLFDRNYVDPVLVAATDGVGTKLKVAQRLASHHTIGIDLVAMCVNDAACCGAEPLLFLDYLAMSRDDPPLVEQIVDGISRGCLECDAALIGGETAILPDVYAPGDYDLAGFCVGVVERRRLIDGAQIVSDDIVLGVASSGLHANGYSLARKIVFEIAGLSGDDQVEVCGQTVGQLLLTPTTIYARPLRQLIQHYRVKQVIHGIAHITGGGLAENIRRILPNHTRVVLRRSSWPVPPVFGWLQGLGGVEPAEMERVFNMGIGLVVIVRPFFADSIQQQLAETGLASWPIGRIEMGPGDVVWE
jgi:phosphoribosylformylglycinamidine cyclo-ligase